MVRLVIVLRKAKRGDKKAGAKYLSREWDSSSRRWRYVYDLPKVRGSQESHPGQMSLFDAPQAAPAKPAKQPAAAQPAPPVVPPTPPQTKAAGLDAAPQGKAARAAQRPAPQRGTFHSQGWEFSHEEIDQLAELWEHKMFGANDYAPLDRRKFSRKVLQYAANRRMIVGEQERRERFPSFHSGLPEGPLYLSSYHNSPEDIPTEVAWRVFKRNVMGDKKQAGASLLRSKGWLAFNIYPAGHHHDTAEQADERDRILLRLAMDGYLIVQSGGSIYDIHDTSEKRLDHTHPDTWRKPRQHSEITGRMRH